MRWELQKANHYVAEAKIALHSAQTICNNMLEINNKLRAKVRQTCIRRGSKPGGVEI